MSLHRLNAMTTVRANLILAAAAALVVACSPTKPASSLGPETPTAATPLPGGPMEPTPSASSPKTPGSQREAQDTVLRYLQKTVNGLPAGTSLDSSDAQGGSNLACDDNYTGPGPGPTEYTAAVHLIGPPGTPPTELIAHTGQLWQSWNLKVTERDGFEKPNRFAYAADGYRLQIEAAYPATYPPTLTVISPCFPGNLRKDDIPFPKTIHQS